jgi:importin subunit alpha-6/7
VVLRKGLPIFLKLIEDKAIPCEVKSDVVWALANIAGDCADYRDRLLNAGVMEKILSLLDLPITYELETICIWLLSNLCRHKNPSPEFRIVKKCISYLIRFLDSGKPEMVTNTCWALKYLADGPWYQIETLIDAGICNRLVTIINSGSESNTAGALLVCINIASGTSKQTQTLINCGIIPAISKLLDNSNDPSILKNIAFLISNIAADEEDKIDVLIQANIFTKLIRIFSNNERLTRLEVLRAVENVTMSGSINQVTSIESILCDGFLYSALEMDSDFVQIALKALQNIALLKKFYLRDHSSVLKGELIQA